MLRYSIVLLSILFLLLYSGQAMSQDGVIGTWTVEGNGLHRSATFNEDGEGAFVMGDNFYPITTFQVVQSSIENQYLISFSVQDETNLETEMYAVIKIENSISAQMQTFYSKSEMLEYTDTALTDAVTVSKD